MSIVFGLFWYALYVAYMVLTGFLNEVQLFLNSGARACRDSIKKTFLK